MAMKIVAIVASPKAEASYSADVLEKLFNRIDGNTKDYTVDTIYLARKDIRDCHGCLTCFAEGRLCPVIDDDMQSIERAIIESDMVIFVSPVYAHNVNSIMKRFIDRISYGLHLLRYIGKYGLIISVASDNGNESVNAYLEMIMLYLGIKVLGSISIQTMFRKENPIPDDLTVVISDLIKGEYDRVSNEAEEHNFETMKRAFHLLADIKETNEVKYWREHHYFDFSSFEELFIAEGNRKKSSEVFLE